MSGRSNMLGRSNRYMESSSPSMVHRTGDSLVVRSVVSGTSLNIPGFEEPDPSENQEEEEDEEEEDEESLNPENLPQCKIKRNYTCQNCSFFTQNPRTYLYHLKDEHKEKIRVYECPKCVYASKHSQKLQRHIHMVHVIGRQNLKLAKKMVPMNKTSASSSRAGPSKEGEESEEETLEIDDLDDMDDEEQDEEEEEDEMLMDTSAHNSSTENDPDANTSQEEIKCSICSFTSHSRTLVQRHENVTHLKKKFFRCTKCNYVTHMKARFTKHVKYHSMPMIKCDLCDFRTPYKWNLDRHYKNHQGDGEFKCPLCNFTADIKQSLTVHVQNHHLTPQQRLMRGMGRRNKVGASDAPAKELRMADVGLVGAAGMSHSPPVLTDDRSEGEVSNQDDDNFQVEVSPSEAGASTSGGVRRQPKIKLTIKKLKNSMSSQVQNDRHNFESDFIHPDDILHKNGKVYYKNLKCSYCAFRAFWEGDILRHESKVHGVENPRHAKKQQQRLARPIPNLIPLQQQPGLQPASPPSTSIIRIPASPQLPEAISEQELNDISSTSALKDFASLIGEAFPTEKAAQEVKCEEQKCEEKPAEKAPPPSVPPKKKSVTSFFDKLKASLVGKEVENLVCEQCGYESKCLSEAVCHKKMHEKETGSNQRSMLGLSSTRCQHCRHRCKTSADLMVHLQTCLNRDSTSDGQGDDESTQDADEKVEEEEPPQCQNCEQRFDTEEDLNKHLDYCKPRLELNPEVSITEVRPQELHPMENKVFVWNQFTAEPATQEMKPALTIERIPSVPQVSLEEVSEDRGEEEEEEEDGVPSLVGVETAPGFGAVTNQKGFKPSEEALHVQRVYKCPQCAFWASAASRFHIHLVGHLNRKPFGCSQCEYRSNWRWDVAKHIRLKGVRDPGHAVQSKPRVLVNDDDTSRRNYSKYSKFLTLMSVRLGQTQSDSPPPSASALPAPPRLIPAPTMPRLEPNRPQPLRPPPPLRAATQHVLSQLANTEDVKRGVKRPLSAEVSVTCVDNKPPTDTVTKRLLWRCKKCNYRGLNKDQVLAHVRTHYQNLPPSEPPHLTPSVQISKCESNSGENFTCDKCPFVGRWLGELKAHQQHHTPQSGAIFKCYLCPFYVGTKRELLNHMRIHGINEPEDHLSRTMQAKMAKKQESEEEGSGDTGSKRYKCSSCPYETNAKGQYVYHIQLHGPSTGDMNATAEDGEGPPFRCNICSYTVGKRHLLNQHLKVHGIVVPPARVSPAPSTPSTPTVVPLDTSKVKDVPLVWVLKNGKYLKMFKCRFCPHVNLRKVNIQEHEKMHKTRKSSAGAPPVTSDPSGMIHRCSQCSYQCNNAGVLSAHAKVHQEWYPRSCALVDLQRSDEVQLKELGGEMAESADGEYGELDAGPPVDPSTSGEASGTSEHQPGEDGEEDEEEDTRLLYFCRQCPARFLFSRELAIHRRFHRIRLQHHCPNCSYTARQPSHLQAHAKVHTQEYQDRTQLLCEQHHMSGEHYKPEILQRDSVWVVVEEDELQPVSKVVVSSSGHLMPAKQYACTRCPARFFKSVALSYHLTLHGGPGSYKCKSCDYSVKMYGNLARHETVHDLEVKKNARASMRDSFTAGSSNENTKLGIIELSDPDIQLTQINVPASQLTVDPVFGTLMHGNPKFVYPTYLKNGKMKEKRYKCHKCPSAFEKREQYKVHLSLHGSRQKYRCERCDYSVKYYANFIQHIRKHKHNDEMRLAHGVPEEGSEEELQSPEEELASVTFSPQRSAAKSISPTKPGHEMSAAERQHLMLQQRRRAAVEEQLKDEPISIVPSYWCPHCPYNSMRRDGVETHSKRHICNTPGIKTTFMCHHCDYSAPQSHFLREHNKLHFRWKQQPPGRRAETYMKCSQVELWSCIVDAMNTEKRLVFQDQGMEEKENKDRFFPEPMSEELSEEGEEEDEVYIDLRTGEVICDEAERLEGNTGEQIETMHEAEKLEDITVGQTEPMHESSDEASPEPEPSETHDSAGE